MRSLQKRALAAFPIVLRSLVLLSVAVLLVSPSQKSHAFAEHFRNPEVRRTIARHSYFTQAEETSSDELAQVSREPTPFLPVIDCQKALRPIVTADVILHEAFPRQFLRLKLGSSPSNSQDPLS